MEKKFLLWGFAFGALAVIIGAFGAHALKDIFTEAQQQSFETGNRYQMYHALLLIVLSRIPFLQTRTILNLIVVGLFLFSVSIYLLNLKDFLDLPLLKFLGPITPIGGVLLISAWSLAFVRTMKQKWN